MKPANRLLLLLSLMANVALAQPRIEVFTQNLASINTVPEFDIIHYDLSEPDRIKKQLAPVLPANESIALDRAKVFLKSEAGKQYMKAMRDAYRGRQKMLQYQLAKLPAIVFEEGRYVIYGSTDVVQALTLYQHYIQDRQE